MKLWNNIVFLLPKWWYNKITMLIWKLRFMICTLGTLSDAINNRYSLTKSFQLFQHKFKIKLWKITLLEIRPKLLLFTYIKFKSRFFINLTFICLMCVLRMSRLEKFINICQASQDHLKTGDFSEKREDRSCPLKTAASCSKQESWSMLAKTCE